MRKIITIIISLVVVGGGAFYGGMKYQQTKSPLDNFSRQNLSEEQRRQFSQGGAVKRTEGGFLSGEVLAKDEQSFTIKMPDGSSRIVFFSESTEISKMTQGTFKDIEIAQQITVSADQNSDATYTAKTIQIR